MTIEITSPEIEAMIRERMDSGAFSSVEEVLLDALAIQQEREEWLQENKQSIEARINRGIAQLDRGEGITMEELRKRLEDDQASGPRETA